MKKLELVANNQTKEEIYAERMKKQIAKRKIRSDQGIYESYLKDCYAYLRVETCLVEAEMCNLDAIKALGENSEIAKRLEYIRTTLHSLRTDLLNDITGD